MGNGGVPRTLAGRIVESVLLALWLMGCSAVNNDFTLFWFIVLPWALAAVLFTIETVSARRRARDIADGADVSDHTSTKTVVTWVLLGSAFAVFSTIQGITSQDATGSYFGYAAAVVGIFLAVRELRVLIRRWRGLE